MINRKHIQSVNFSYFKRTSDDKPQHKYHDKYTLISLARNNISGIEIFQHYFCSIYNKKFLLYFNKLNKDEETIQIKKEHCSYFFQKFIRIVILRSLVGENINQTVLCDSISEDILGPPTKNEGKTNYEAQKKLIYSFVSDIYKQEYRYLSKKHLKSYLDSALQIENQIKKVCDFDFLKDVQQFKKIQNQQFLPPQLNDKLQILFIKSNFECICNIQILRKRYKKQILQQFYHRIKNHLAINIEYLMDSKYNADPNIILLPKYTVETSPVIMKLQTYLQIHLRNKIHKFNQQINQQPQQRPVKLIFKEICINIVKDCLKYFKNTLNFYPTLSIGDISIDQKKLSIILQYKSLLLDALGLNNNTKNFQMRLATEPTPNVVNFQKYFKQFVPKYQLLMNRKYYQPKYNYNDKNQEEQLKKNQKNLIQTDLIELEKQFLHQMHVWRLINIIYYIHNNSFFSNDYYNGKFHNKTQKKQFYYQKYIQKIQQAANKLLKGDLKLLSVIPIIIGQNLSSLVPRINETQITQQQQRNIQNQLIESSKSSNQQNKNQLNFNSLLNYLNIQDNNDSLYEQLRWQKFRFELYNRQMMVKDLNKLVLNDKYAFTKLSNPKKYFFIYYLNRIENIQQNKLKRDKIMILSQHQNKNQQINRQAQLINQLSKQINKVNLLKQNEKRQKTINDAIIKFSQYNNRGGKVAQYVNKDNKLKNIKIIEQKIVLMHKYWSCYNYILARENSKNKLYQILDIFLSLITNQNNQILKNVVQLLNQFKQNTITVKQVSQAIYKSQPFFRKVVEQLINQITDLLQKGIKKIIQQISFQENPHQFPQYLNLKNQKEQEKALRQETISKYFSCKFKLMIDCFLQQKQKYWKQYQNLSKYKVEQILRKQQPLSIGDVKKEINIQEKMLIKCQHQD